MKKSTVVHYIRLIFIYYEVPSFEIPAGIFTSLERYRKRRVKTSFVNLKKVPDNMYLLSNDKI